MARRVLALSILFALLGASCARGERSVSILGPYQVVRGYVKVEVADTMSARETGLMRRAHLDEDAGMLFVFPAPDYQTFWMKNTEIPLDMIFADDAGRVIGFIEDAKPYSEALLAVPGKSLYVLEVNGGWARRHGIKRGDRFAFGGFTPEARN